MTARVQVVQGPSAKAPDLGEVLGQGRTRKLADLWLGRAEVERVGGMRDERTKAMLVEHGGERDGVGLVMGAGRATSRVAREEGEGGGA